VRVVLAVGAGILTLAACGSGSGSSTTQPARSATTSQVDTKPTTDNTTLAESIAATLQDTSMWHSLKYSPAEASCLAKHVINKIGAPRLVQLGANGGTDLAMLDWTVGERDMVFGSMRQCVDIHAQLVAVFSSDSSVDSDVAECVATAYEQSDVLPDALFSTEPDPALSQRVDKTIGEAFNACS
jgi:hypothetical protein